MTTKTSARQAELIDASNIPPATMRQIDQLPAPVGAETILSVIQRAAADQNCDIDKMERLLDMHERMLAKQAEQAFADALAIMQSELPVIRERGEILDKNKNVQSTYALWEDVNEQIKPLLTKYGFSLSFRVLPSERGIHVEGVLLHRFGHRETTSILLPADVSGNKNAVQAVASSVSYGKRYTAGALLNFTSTGEDDDGSTAGAPPVKTITPAQRQALEKVIAQCHADRQAKVVEEFPDLSQVPAHIYDAMMAGLKAKAAAYQQSITQEGAQQ
jgi:hypothetical protein